MQGTKRSSSQRWAGRILLGLVSVALSLLAARYAAENLFFDKFYYRKSVAHGYDPNLHNPLPMSAYGKRSADLVRLQEEGTGPAPPQRVQRPRPDPRPYTIVVLGDSFCWGQGLREAQRWVHLLELRLERTRPTRVISLCAPGDGLVRHLIKYRASGRIWPADLYIFALVTDDLLYSPREPVDKAARTAIAACEHLPQTLLNQTSTMSMLGAAYARGSANRCVMERIIPLLPHKRALYVDYGWPWNTYAPMEQTLMRLLRHRGRDVVTLIPPPACEDQGPDCEDEEAPPHYYVSDRERHPSARLNVTFADAIYQYIIKRKAYGFSS